MKQTLTKPVSGENPVILLATLGLSWPIIPEIYFYLAPDVVDFYKNHSDHERIRKDAEQLRKPDEIWLITTDTENADNASIDIDRLHEWATSLPGTDRVALRIWRLKGIPDITNQASCKSFRELTFRVTCLAVQKTGSPKNLFIALAGGRKTMSSDLYKAAVTFGCNKIIHVLSGVSGELNIHNNAERIKTPDYLTRSAPVSNFLKPLPKYSSETSTSVNSPCADWVTPLIIGTGRVSEILSLKVPGYIGSKTISIIDTVHFPVDHPEENNIIVDFALSESSPSIVDEIERRESQGSQLLTNYLSSFSTYEHHENWRNLYRLPPSSIENLRNTHIDREQASHKELFKQLPKAELHAHIGGYLTIEAQKRVGTRVFEGLSQNRRRKIRADETYQFLLRTSHWHPYIISELNNTAIQKWEYAAALLDDLSVEELDTRLYSSSSHRRFALKKEENGFRMYEAPGDLAGSTILQTETAVSAYAMEVFNEAVRQGLRYCEIRGSAGKYMNGNGLRFIDVFKEGLEEARKEYQSRGTKPDTLPDVRFIIICNRKDNVEKITGTIELALEAHEKYRNFVVGIDLAGNEAQGEFDQLRKVFKRAMTVCLPTTIHAGEGEPAENIWKAVYELNCDRIGHGLTLTDLAEDSLLAKFRNRNIAIELCPTSNIQVVGFKHPDYPEQTDAPPYPLRRLYNSGLSIVVCTDNPGINKSDLVNEFFEASLLCGDDPLSLWEALSIIKRGFAHSFMPVNERERLLKEMDAKIFSIIVEYFGK